MHTLSIDIETYSSNDLKKCGVYKYTQAFDFEIILFQYKLDDGPVIVVDLLNGEKLPQNIFNALTDPDYIKSAHNAAFEIPCIEEYYGIELDPMQWRCTMVLCAYYGLPMSLDDVGTVLRLKTKKDSRGKALIKFFTVPRKPTKKLAHTRNLPSHDPIKWQEFKEYGATDVVVENSIKNKLHSLNFALPDSEQKLWALDFKINKKGVQVDVEFVKNVMAVDAVVFNRLKTEGNKITGLSNSNSGEQLKDWIFKKTGWRPSSLAEEFIEEILMDTKDPDIQKMMELKLEMAKSSIRKYNALYHHVGFYDRYCGLLQFYGASRTGRFSAKGVQVHNLRKNYIKSGEEDLVDLARNLVFQQDIDTLELCFGNIRDILSQLIRTSFIAAPNHYLVPADFAQIEARVLAWLAGEQWKVETFKSGKDVYLAAASRMFRVPIETLSKKSPERQKGKIAELALGYQGGANALITANALKVGLTIDDCEAIVDAWRMANPAIKQFWYDCNKAAIKAIKGYGKIQIQHGITFFKDKGVLFIQLPSGRRLSYLRAGLEPNQYGGESITYEGRSDKGLWGKQRTYGGKLVENIVQATARDCLTLAMQRIDKAGYNIVMHVHDEIITEVPGNINDECNTVAQINRIDEIMSLPISWANGLPLKADSYKTLYYRKDD